MEKFKNTPLTPEQIAEIEKSRTISDARMLEEGARYVVDATGNKRLDPTSEQFDKANEMMAADITSRRSEIKPKTHESVTSEQSVKRDDVHNLQAVLLKIFGESMLGDLMKDINMFERVGYETTRLVPVVSQTVKLIGKIEKGHDLRSINDALQRVEKHLLQENIKVVTPSPGRPIPSNMHKFFMTETGLPNKNLAHNAVIRVVSPAFVDNTTGEMKIRGHVIINH
jgi:hypothetical protein